MVIKDDHCVFYELLIEKFILKDISPGDDGKLQEHLEVCPGCKARLEIIQRNNRLLSAEPEITPSPGFKEKLLKHLEVVERHKQKNMRQLADQ